MVKREFKRWIQGVWESKIGDVGDRPWRGGSSCEPALVYTVSHAKLQSCSGAGVGGQSEGSITWRILAMRPGFASPSSRPLPIRMTAVLTSNLGSPALRGGRPKPERPAHSLSVRDAQQVSAQGSRRMGVCAGLLTRWCSRRRHRLSRCVAALRLREAHDATVSIRQLHSRDSQHPMRL